MEGNDFAATATNENMRVGTVPGQQSDLSVVNTLAHSVAEGTGNSSGATTTTAVQSIDRNRSDQDIGLRVRAKRRLPATSRRSNRARFVLHEMWEGVVEEVFDTYFVADLESKTLYGTREVAEIYTCEVSLADRELLRPGAVFYWSIGYEDRPSGQRVRSSILRFRRLPPLPRPANDPWIEAVRDQWLTSS